MINNPVHPNEQQSLGGKKEGRKDGRNKKRGWKKGGETNQELIYKLVIGGRIARPQKNSDQDT